LIFRFLKLNPENVQHRNAYLLVVELFWAAILGSAGTFNAAFALRLEASNADVAYLSSIPALLAVLVSVPAGRFLQARTRRTPWIFWALFINRLSYLLIAAIPWLGGLHIPLGSLVVGVLVLSTLPAHFFNVGWFPLLAEAVDARSRAGLVTARMMIANATTALFSFLFGQLLSYIVFPYNYTLMYVIGFSASVGSMLCLIKLKIPDAVPVVRQPGTRLSLARLRQEMVDHPGLTRIIMNTFMHGMGLWVASPLYILRYVRELDAKDAWIGLSGTIATLAAILATPVWRKIMARWGQSATLKRTIVLIGLYPIAVGFLPSLTLILFAIGIYNMIAPGVNLSHFTTLLEVTPEENRPGYTSWYISLVNTGAFVGPLLGVAIADRLGIAPTLVICGVLSILGSTSFWWWPVKDDPQKPIAEKSGGAS
jgi:Na+/melibiose symporter-like transporter